MKHRIASLIVTLAFSAAPAFAAPITLTAVLSGGAEAPPTPSTGTGTATVTIDPVAHTLDLQVSFSSLLASTTASHIHVMNGLADSNHSDFIGPVAIAPSSLPGFPLGVTSGTYLSGFGTLSSSIYATGFLTGSGGTASSAEEALFAGLVSGNAYLNIHTSQFPGGEIRGFFQPPATPVPEPASLLLLATGGAAIVAVRRRRPTA